MWVDAFHEGIRSPGEADELVAAARRAHLNTLIASGLVLFALTLVVNMTARAVVERRKEFSGAN